MGGGERVLSLQREAARCGGVVAALLTALRRSPSGARIKIVDIGGMRVALEEALSRLEDLGMARVESRGSEAIVIVKT